MIVQIFGIIDLLAAALLHLGSIPAPAFLVGALIIFLLLKGIISIYPFPLYLPGILMSAADVLAAILLYFGTTPAPEIKTAVILVLLIKSVPSLVSGLFLLLGVLGSRK